MTYSSENKHSNGHFSCSSFLSYYFGNSFMFSLHHIIMMQRLYLYFPIYLESMNRINWASYLELLMLKRKECYFYYNLLLFCGDNSVELKNLIKSDLYCRI